MPPEIREVCERIRKVSKDVSILGRLDRKRSKLVSSAVRVMTTSQTVRPFKVYQEFLYDVLRAAGCSMVVLSSASLGKDTVVQLKAERRTILVDYIACHVTSLGSSALSSLAVAFSVPRNDDASGEPPAPVLEHGLEAQAGAPPQQVISAKQNKQTVSTTTINQDPLVLPLTLPAAKVFAEAVVNAVEDGHNDRLAITLPKPDKQKPFMSIPFEICAKVMRMYTAEPTKSAIQTA